MCEAVQVDSQRQDVNHCNLLHLHHPHYTLCILPLHRCHRSLPDNP